MPEPPETSLLMRLVLENPVPAGLAMLVIAAIIAWRGAATDRLKRVGPWAGGLAVAGVLVMIVGAAVVTAGEHARRVVEGIVEDAVAGDSAGVLGHFAPEATISFGRPTNPRFELGEIERRAEGLEGRYRIATNRVTMLDAYTASSRRGVVHLACLTTLTGGWGPVPTQWVVQVEPQDDGSWKVVHLTWVSIAGRPPSSDVGR